jgi:hypothetical protein
VPSTVGYDTADWILDVVADVDGGIVWKDEPLAAQSGLACAEVD